MRQLGAEFFGTFVLVASVLGAALFGGGLFAHTGATVIAVALSVGIAVMAMAYAVGHVSGGHFNPAVTIGLIAGGRFEVGKSIGYIIAQVLGGVAAALVFWFIASQIDFADPSSIKVAFENFASNGYDANSPGKFSLLGALVAEIVVTAIFLIIIMGATSKGAPAGFAPIAIGLGLGMLHLVSIPVTNASINPARSIATALVSTMSGGWGMTQVWLFIVGPIIGGIIGGVIGRWLQEE
jgi:aquaporin Z